MICNELKVFHLPKETFPGNEELLIKIIELLLPGKHISSLELRDKENHGFTFDLYMHKLPERPDGFEEDMLKLLYDAAEFANMSIDQQTEYETVMRTEIDIIAEKAFARRTGHEEGRTEIALEMLRRGMDQKIVADITKLPEEDLRKLQ